MPTAASTVIEQARAARHRRQRDVRHFLRAEPQQRVGVPIAGPPLMLQVDHVETRVNGLVVDGEQDVARPYAGAAGGRGRRDFRRHDAHRALDPEHAVFDFVGGGSRHDVGEAEGKQRERHRDGQRGLPPLTPPGFAVVHAYVSRPRFHHATALGNAGRGPRLRRGVWRWFVEFAEQERSIQPGLEQTVYRAPSRLLLT